MRISFLTLYLCIGEYFALYLCTHFLLLLFVHHDLLINHEGTFLGGANVSNVAGRLIHIFIPSPFFIRHSIYPLEVRTPSFTRNHLSYFQLQKQGRPLLVMTQQGRPFM